MLVGLIYVGGSAAAFFCELGGELLFFGIFEVVIRFVQFGEINTLFGARELECRRDG